MRKIQNSTASLEGFHRYFDLADCLQFLSRECGRLGISEYDLPPYQRALLTDLWRPLDEWAVAQLHNYWEYDQQALLHRTPEYRKHTPVRPRIDVVVEITTKGNLKAEWFPRDYRRFTKGNADSDFKRWSRLDHRFGAFDSRPSNELFFLHDFEHVLGSLLPQSFHHSTAALDQVLLAACAKVVEKLKDRLEHHVEVRMCTDVFVEWQEQDHDGVERWFTDSRIVKWEIDDPAERTAAAEREELDEMESRPGFSEPLLIEVWNAELDRKGRSGPAPSPHTLMERIARELKRRGKPATKGKVERAIKLISRHRQPFR